MGDYSYQAFYNVLHFEIFLFPKLSWETKNGGTKTGLCGK